MADDKKNIPDVASPTEAPAPTVEVAAVPEPPSINTNLPMLDQHSKRFCMVLLEK